MTDRQLLNEMREQLDRIETLLLGDGNEQEGIVARLRTVERKVSWAVRAALSALSGAALLIGAWIRSKFGMS